MPIIKELRELDQRVSYVDLSRNFGKETAMIAGFDHAKSDALIILDADLQDPPELIPEMIYYKFIYIQFFIFGMIAIF